MTPQAREGRGGARRRCLTLYDPIRDDNLIPLWLVPGDWTRGRAAAHVAVAEGEPFVRCCARRVWMRWVQGSGYAGWQLDDGMLLACDRADDDAEPFWEVSLTPAPERAQ